MHRKLMVMVMALVVLVGLLPACSSTPAPTVPSAPKPAAAPAPAPAAPATITLKFASTNVATHLIILAIEESMRQSLDRMTNGRVKVEMYPGESLAKGTETLSALKGGVCDLAHLPVDYWPGVFTLTATAGLPGLAASATSAITTATNEVRFLSDNIFFLLYFRRSTPR